MLLKACLCASVTPVQAAHSVLVQAKMKQIQISAAVAVSVCRFGFLPSSKCDFSEALFLFKGVATHEIQEEEVKQMILGHKFIKF